MEQYDICAIAHLIRYSTDFPEKFSVRIQKTNAPVSVENVLLHYFDVSDPEKSQSSEVYLGRFQDFEEVNVTFQNETVDPGFMEDVTIPVICLKSSNTQPELTLCGEGVELKVLFLLKKAEEDVRQNEPDEATITAPFVPSSSAYRAVRNSVIAVANSRIYVNEALHTVTSTVHYVLDGGRFILSVSYDLSRDFLVSLDMVCGECFQLVDQQLDTVRSSLLESLGRLARQLRSQLQNADQTVALKIHHILRLLLPYINKLARAIYPYVSMALYLSKPLRTVLYPYVEPILSKAQGVHNSLQHSPLLGPLITTATERAMLVIHETSHIYAALEQEEYGNRKKLK